MHSFLQKIVVLAIMIVPMLAFADSVYVQSKVAKIYGDKSFKAEVLKTIKRGEKLEVIRRQGNWVQVKIGTLEGWIPSLLISEDKPVKKDSVLVDKGKEIKDTARRRASSTSVAGAARGLQGEEESGEVGESDYDALNEVESMSHSEEEIRKFIDEGKQQSE